MTLTDKAAFFARTETEEGTVGEVPEMAFTTDVSEAVQRVARALCIAACDEPDKVWTFIGPHHHVVGWSQYVTEAKAAIAAIAEPTEPMWSGLARQIVMWHRQSRPTGANLHRDLKNMGWPIPDWLAAEIENADYVPPKGAVAVAIYRAQIDAALGNPPVAR